MNAVIIEHDAAAGRTTRAPTIPDLTLPQFVLGDAQRRGSKRALVNAATGHQLSYAGLADAVRETGAGLSARGVCPGDVLALCAPNSIEFAVAWYAATAIGAIVTGDIVTADQAGWFYVTDRVKELIKYKGYQVAPAELEAVLLTHPAVADAAVVRRTDELAGEIPRAFVVLRAPASAQELMAWVAGRVASYKRVRQVEFIDSIPKSPSGKILRRLLVELDASAGSQTGSGDGGHDN